MPNWCYNSLTISHDDPEMMDRLVEHAKAPLQELIPCPHDPETSDKWYDWRVNNWGTKWDIELQNMQDIDSNTISATFDSAWSPPIEAYRKLESMGFTIDAFYYEGGMCFAGRYTNGNDKSVEYSFSNENWSDEIGDDDIAEFLMPEYENWQIWNDEQEKTNDAA